MTTLYEKKGLILVSEIRHGVSMLSVYGPERVDSRRVTVVETEGKKSYEKYGLEVYARICATKENSEHVEVYMQQLKDLIDEIVEENSIGQEKYDEVEMGVFDVK